MEQTFIICTSVNIIIITGPAIHLEKSTFIDSFVLVCVIMVYSVCLYVCACMCISSLFPSFFCMLWLPHWVFHFFSLYFHFLNLHLSNITMNITTFYCIDFIVRMIYCVKFISVWMNECRKERRPFQYTEHTKKKHL